MFEKIWKHEITLPDKRVVTDFCMAGSAADAEDMTRSCMKHIPTEATFVTTVAENQSTDDFFRGRTGK